MKCISPFKMRKHSGKWQEHPSTPFTGVSESCHGSRVNGHLSSLTKEHKVSERPDMCQGGGGRGQKHQWPKEPPPGNRQPPLCEEYPVKLHLTTSKMNWPCHKFQSRGQVECKLFFWLWPCPFVFPSNLLLPSPPGVCLVSPSVRLVSLHAGRQPVSLSSF